MSNTAPASLSTPFAYTEAIRYFHHELELVDPGCTCHTHPPCSRCVESEDDHGNDRYGRHRPDTLCYYTNPVTGDREVYRYDASGAYELISLTPAPSAPPEATSAPAGGPVQGDLPPSLPSNPHTESLHRAASLSTPPRSLRDELRLGVHPNLLKDA